MNCIKCKDLVTDYVDCTQCHGKLHYGCAGIKEVTYRNYSVEKKGAWRCPPCRAAVTTAVAVSPAPSDPPRSDTVMLAEVLSELKAFRADFGPLKTDVQTCVQGISELNSKWRDVETKVSQMDGRLATVEKKLSEAEKTISTFKLENDKREQFARMNNIEICGIPQKPGENLYNILQNISVLVGCKINDFDVDMIQRVRRYPSAKADGRAEVEAEAGIDQGGEPSQTSVPNIVVRFTRRRVRDELLAAVRARRSLDSAQLGFTGSASSTQC